MKCKFEESESFACSGNIEVRGAMTAYHFEGVLNSPEDPNKDFLCCDLHYQDYEYFWQSQWDEYYGIVHEGIVAGQLDLAKKEQRDAIERGPLFQELFDDFASRVTFK